MEDTQIISFSLESLKMKNFFVEAGDYIYRDCFFAYRETISNSQLGIFRYPCRFNAYIGILCTSGEAEVIHNLRRYTIKEDTIFFTKANDIIQLEKWKDVEFYVIAFNDSFIRNVNIDYKRLLSEFLELQKYPCIGISREEAASLSNTFKELSADLQFFKDLKYSDEILMTYISLSAYKAFSVIDKHKGKLNNGISSISHHNEEYMNKFMDLLGKNFYREHGIDFYASQICITPKYLTSLIKKISGKSASQWIDEYLILEAKHLIKFSKMNIQEIADYLNFSNQSVFSQYFKRQAGMTPSDYKMS